MLQNNKHVIFCTSGIFPESVGGIQRHSKLLIEELAKTKSLHLTVIHPHISKRMFDAEYNVHEIAIDFNHADGNYLYNCYKYSKLVYAELAKYPDAIIYTQGLNVWYQASKLNGRLIYNPHGLEPFQGQTLRDKITTWPFRIVMRKVFKQATYVISLGGHLTSILKASGVPESKIKVLPNATNIPDAVLKTENDICTFLFVGRFAHNKGIALLLQAIKELNAEGFEKQMHFNLVGKGPLFNQMISEYRLPNITFAGFANDEQLKEFYSSSDAFVFPTLFEGMPTVVLEAMSYKLPIIVSDVGATAEQVDSNNGFLIEKNNLLQLKDAIKKFVLLTAEERKNMGEQSLTKVKEKFTWKAVAQRHLHLFNTIK
jgi:glycosyltransferase involved in cell wall biosynthesis